MKRIVYKQVPLYRFLDLCLEENQMTNRILDCGAGGATPPLGLFKMHGFDTYGIDIDLESVQKANAYGNEHGMVLNIHEGDMTRLPMEDDTFDFAYSYNSIFHMKKNEIKRAIAELKRVLKPGGLLFVNFLSVDDFRCGEGPDLGNNQYEQMDDTPVIHSYFEYDEADIYFSDMTMLIKERRVLNRIYEGNMIEQGFIDYILRKDGENRHDL